MDDSTGAGASFIVELCRELPFKDARRRLLERFETTYVRLLLERHNGNVSAAARESNLSRKHIRTLLDRYGLRKSPTEPEE